MNHLGSSDGDMITVYLRASTQEEANQKIVADSVTGSQDSCRFQCSISDETTSGSNIYWWIECKTNKWWKLNNNLKVKGNGNESNRISVTMDELEILS